MVCTVDRSAAPPLYWEDPRTPKAMRQRNKFALEIYDKDNDVYETIAENDDINILREKAIAIADKNPTMNSGEPVDWFLITDCVAETPIEYFDMYEKAWKKYHQ